MNSPAKLETDLTPAAADELRPVLKKLFTQFPSQDGNAAWKLAGYLEACQGEPLWAVKAAVDRFCHGRVSSHEGRWLPTSAELARVVREESGTARRMAERQEPRPMLTDQRITEISEEKREQNYRRLKELAAVLGGGTETRDDKLAALEIVQAAPVRRELVEALERQRRPE